MGIRLQYKSMTLNDLERQFTALSSVLCVLRPNAFWYKVALYHSYLPIKFDDDIQGVPWSGGLKIGWGVFNFLAPYLEDGARQSLGPD